MLVQYFEFLLLAKNQTDRVYSISFYNMVIIEFKELSMAVSITKDNFNQEIEESTMPIVMDVFASWCGPCQQMAPHFEALEKELKDIYKFVKLNVDEARDISIKYGVTSVPTFIFIQNNQIKGKVTGYMSKNDLKARIEEYLG